MESDCFHRKTQHLPLKEVFLQVVLRGWASENPKNVFFSFESGEKHQNADPLFMENSQTLNLDQPL